MPESLGARLRQRRESQQISLSTIADVTKIKLSLLEGLERDDISHWPAGIFRRAYIRSYARAIHVDPDTLVREFLDVHPDPPELIAPDGTAQMPDSGGAHGGSPASLRSLVGAAIGSLSRFSRKPPAEYDRVEEPPVIQHAFVVPAEPPDVDFGAVAKLSVEFAKVESADDLKPLLVEAAKVLDATGVIVWMWDARAAALRPALACGYPDKVLAQVPAVRRDADNATAAAYRLAETCAILGTEDASGALAVPLLTSGGCAGVLAIELQNGREQSEQVRSAATIFAALLAQLTGPSRQAQAPRDAEMAVRTS